MGLYDDAYGGIDDSFGDSCSSGYDHLYDEIADEIADETEDETREDIEKELVEQFEMGGSTDKDEDPMDNITLATALGFAEEMTPNIIDHENLFNDGNLDLESPEQQNKLHQTALSLKSGSTKKEDPFWTYVKETVAGTRSLDEIYTKKERHAIMRGEFV